MGRLAARIGLAIGIAALAVALLLFRFAVVTDYAYHALVKDPERTPPAGDVVVAPADGTVIYVREVRAGVAPEIVKRGVPVPLVDHMKLGAGTPLPDGWLVGIYMNTDGVHVNRAPVPGTLTDRTVWNGPHLEMSAAERTIILTQLVPGWVALKRWLGLAPYAIEDDADFVLKSARETLEILDERETRVYVTRIADYTVGKILTWVTPGERVERGERIGMITWGSQTDVFFAASPGSSVRVAPGAYVYAGETVLATY